jgi:hypothetical protein
MLVSKFPYVILNGHHHERSIKLFQRLQSNFCGQIHFDGHWKEWAFKIETFLALKLQRAKRVPFGHTQAFPHNNFDINSDNEKCVRYASST